MVDGDAADFTVSVNGTYDFIITDNGGNTATLHAEVGNVDTARPAVDSILNRWTAATAPSSRNTAKPSTTITISL